MSRFLIVEARFYDHLNDMLVAGAKAACPSARIMLHIDRGGDNGASRWFYDNARASNQRANIDPEFRQQH